MDDGRNKPRRDYTWEGIGTIRGGVRTWLLWLAIRTSTKFLSLFPVRSPPWRSVRRYWRSGLWLEEFAFLLLRFRTLRSLAHRLSMHRYSAHRRTTPQSLTGQSLQTDSRRPYRRAQAARLAFRLPGLGLARVQSGSFSNPPFFSARHSGNSTHAGGRPVISSGPGWSTPQFLLLAPPLMFKRCMELRTSTARKDRSCRSCS